MDAGMLVDVVGPGRTRIRFRGTPFLRKMNVVAEWLPLGRFGLITQGDRLLNFNKK